MVKLIKNIITFSLKNKYFIIASSVILVAWGIYVFMDMPIEAFPDVTNTEISIITQWPGRSAEEVEKFITIPIEIALKYNINTYSETLASLQDLTILFNELETGNNKTKEQLIYNNFGICSMYTVMAEDKLGVFQGKSHIVYERADRVTSTDLELVIYTPMNTVLPKYKEFLRLLKTNDEDVSYINKYAPNTEPHEFTLSPGASLEWQLADGSILYSQLDNAEETIASKSIIVRALKGKANEMNRHYLLQCPDSYEPISEM